MEEEKDKVNTKVSYPAEDSFKNKVLFALVYLTAPVALLTLAVYSFRALIGDLGVFGMKPGGGSAVLVLFGLIGGLGGAGFLFWQCFKYGSFKNYYYAKNSKAFKAEALRLISEIRRKFETLTAGDESGAAVNSRKNMDACVQEFQNYKAFWRAGSDGNKMETVTYNEILKLKAIVDAEEFSLAEFAAMSQKVRFCAEERFHGVGSAKAYKGAGDYTFISYAHRNSKIVLPAIKRFQAEGLNIWFDEGITEGEDWMNHIAGKIDGCSHFIMFQSTAYAKSANCNVEIKRALRGDKTIIRVVLEDCELQKGLEMYLDVIQAIDCRTGIEDKMDRIIALLGDN